jgi:hypothetical protein
MLNNVNGQATGTPAPQPPAAPTNVVDVNGKQVNVDDIRAFLSSPKARELKIPEVMFQDDYTRKRQEEKARLDAELAKLAEERKKLETTASQLSAEAIGRSLGERLTAQPAMPDPMKDTEYFKKIMENDPYTAMTLLQSEVSKARLLNSELDKVRNEIQELKVARENEARATQSYYDNVQRREASQKSALYANSVGFRTFVDAYQSRTDDPLNVGSPGNQLDKATLAEKLEAAYLKEIEDFNKVRAENLRQSRQTMAAGIIGGGVEPELPPNILKETVTLEELKEYERGLIAQRGVT